MVGVRQEKTRQDYETYEYLICFVDRPEVNWWDWLFRTREGFRHCFVLQWCEWSNRWIMVEWRQSRTDFMVFFDFEVSDIINGLGARKGTAVHWQGPPSTNDGGHLITYCSNIISRYLGLGNDVLLTPYALYRRLLATGGEVVFSWRDENHEQ